MQRGDAIPTELGENTQTPGHSRGHRQCRSPHRRRIGGACTKITGEGLDAVTSPFQPRPGLERYAQPAPADFGPYTTYCGT
ncbi:hypothetical protein [Dietzia timorensis]|uniref:UPF0061 protein n=1 Tax=Dietzia timorensis TaxID=499555 RepID=A0A173LNY2_9ACTN|nr:hypothetical protein [Dietzia timorensis]ANI93613.1 UPF0061 protein [Dietzia timorensis]